MPGDFSLRVVAWQREHGRHDLPWQRTRDAYRIWLSEVMLQQTQVTTVLPYFERFMARFPAVSDLAAAPEEEVMRLWSGLGYYARARNLHAAAKQVVERHGGVFPARFDDLVALPGVGRSTAAAIAAFASGERRAILDGNVRRVLARHGGVEGDPSSNAVQAKLWALAEARLPEIDIEPYTQGMMDLGAGICTTRNPACLLCPVAADCVARLEDRVDQLPGKRVRREAPRRKVAMLVVVSRGEVLLEKRPSTGIWGGLWSLPEAPVEADVASEIDARFGIRHASLDALPPFEHAFTHFTLEVAPWKVTPRKAPALPAGATWLPLADVNGAALPSPVKALLKKLGSDPRHIS